ncbi:MAG: ABC transporter ATP-binding protein [Armatimonadota bacterium]
MARFLAPFWVLVLIGPLLMAVEVAMDLMQPRLTQTIIDQGIAQNNLALVIRVGLLMVGAALVGAVGGIGNCVVGVRVAQGFGARLRHALYSKVQSLSFSNLDKLGTGPLITRLTSDVTQVQEAILALLRVMVRAPLILVGSMIMAIVTSPKLSILLWVMLPPLLATIVLFFLHAHPLFLRVQERLDRLNTVIQENLANVRLVKAFVRGEYEAGRFGEANAGLASAMTRAMQFVAGVMPQMMLITNAGVVAALWLGGASVVRGDLQVGQLVAFINYLSRTLMSLIRVSMLLMQLSRAGASAIRIVEILDTEPDVKEPREALRSFEPQGRVAFEHVTFGYDEDEDEAALQDITFEVEPGQMVAILGATGSGKSSLVHLIPRFYDVTEGRVTLDGVDVRELSLETLRRNIGIVLQETVLFSGTVRDNIRYGRPDATDEEVMAAAMVAQAHDFIMAMPEGYDTRLGQQGVNLSGGQKQRIAIARALLIQPKVLILDDSTSSVDVETEARISAALRGLMKDRTVFLIAQRVSTVLTADKILVLDKGRLVAEGPHKELLTTCPLYRDIYDSQLGDD